MDLNKLIRNDESNFIMKKLLFSVVVLFGIGTSLAQQKVTGIIKDANGMYIAGASVAEKGTSNGVISNFDGQYEITTTSSNATLVFSFIGYMTQEIAVGSKKEINVTFEEDLAQLSEVVVIGYGTQKREEVTSAIATVKSEDFIQGAVSDAAQLIQGKVAGLAIVLPSGDPTSETQVLLRGTSSLYGNSAPLVLIDGIPGEFSTVAPQDIESINVLKDGSATAIYGTRGTNGVIIITTKQSNKEMAPTIEYTSFLSFSTISKKLNFLNADELRQKWNEGYTFNGANLQDYGGNTDWLNEITRDAVSHVHNLVFRGGSKATNLTASLNIKDNEGTFIKTDNKKMTGRIDVSHNMFDGKLKSNFGVIVSEQKYFTGGDGYSFDPYVYRQAIIRNPTEPIINDDGTWFERDIYRYDNPVAYLNETIGENKYRKARFTGGLAYDITPDIEIKGLFTRKGESNIRGFYQTKNHVSTTKNGLNGFASRGTEDYVGNYGQFTIDYKKDFGKHKITGLLGYNYEDNTTEGFWMTNSDFPSDAFTYNNIGQGDGINHGDGSVSSYKNSNTLIAFFSRFTYNYDDRYLFMASIRREGSSRFGEDNKWGNFPGVSIGWRINNESFMENKEWLNNLKLRAGFGITGINSGSDLESLSSLNYGNSFLYNGNWIKELVPARNANPNLKWEVKEEFNVGLDFGILKNRINGALDYYSRTTKDALWRYDVPTPPYLTGSILANVGEIKNKGFEALLNVIPIQNENTQWNVSFTYSTNTNKLVSISNDQFQSSNNFFDAGYTGEPIQLSTHRVQVGGPIGNFYGLKSVDITDDGIWLIEKPDGSIIPATESSTDDRQVLGNGLPKHYLSMNNSFRYKGWDLNVNFRGAFGYQILNFQRMFYENPTVSYNTLDSAYDKVYGKAVLSDVQRFVSYYIEDGDYIKLDNVTLGFTLPKNAIKFAQSLRIYASGINLATFTKYKGIDPEVDITREPLAPGNDNRDQYPTNRTFSVGINLTF
jgi:TonB-linked SusC/RagA family outer membrane protein